MKHLDNLSQRLRISGYDETYRYQVIKSGVEGFDKMMAEAEQGGRPINSPRTWEEDLRQRNEYFKKKGGSGKEVTTFHSLSPTLRGGAGKKMEGEGGPEQPGQVNQVREREIFYFKSDTGCIHMCIVFYRVFKSDLWSYMVNTDLLPATPSSWVLSCVVFLLGDNRTNSLECIQFPKKS